MSCEVCDELLVVCEVSDVGKTVQVHTFADFQKKDAFVDDDSVLEFIVVHFNTSINVGQKDDRM